MTDTFLQPDQQNVCRMLKWL